MSRYSGNGFRELLSRWRNQRHSSGEMPSGSGRMFGAIIGLSLAGYAATHCLYNVDGGHRAVVFSRIFGVKDQVIGEGTHIRIPWLEWPVVYDVRARPRKIEGITGSKDLQMVNISLRVLSRPDTEKLPHIYRTLGKDYDERILPSIVHEVLKSVVALFNASQLITQREKVSRLIHDRLYERAAQFNLILDDVAIMSVTFGHEFTAAVEAKQIAQQEAQRAAFVVEKAKQEKQSIIVRSEGEAKAAQMIGEAIRNNPGFIQLRRIEAARDIAQTLSTAKNRVFLDSELLMLDFKASVSGQGN